MKLTTSQLATIETYLLSWELQFRDFYDEMFDHFCSEIEQRMSGGKTFDNALAETSLLFENHTFKTGMSSTYRGIKAYEMEWLVKQTQRNNGLFLSELKQQIFSPQLLIWTLIYVAIYYASVQFDLQHLWLLMFAPTAFFMLFAQTKIFTGKGFSWKDVIGVGAINYKNAPVHKSKYSLFDKTQILIRTVRRTGVVFLFLFNLPHFFIRTEDISVAIYVAFGLVMLLFSFITNNVINDVLKQKQPNILELLTST